MQQEFYEFLLKNKLSPHKLKETISKWGKRDLIKFHENIYHSFDIGEKDFSGKFAFIANGKLSGRPYPCNGLRCRLLYIDQLARFAVLYGDHVLIQSPFPEDVFHGKINVDESKIRLFNDLVILHYIRPLVEYGFIIIGNRILKFDEEHSPPIHKKGKLKNIIDTLYKEFSRNVYFNLERDDDRHNCVIAKGPDSLVEHGIMKSYIKKSQKIKLSKKKYDGLNRIIGNSRRNLIYDIASPIIIDIIQQDFYSSRNKLNYLTNRDIDLSILETTNSIDKQRISRAIVEGFSHSLPFIKGTKLSSILKLRIEEGEAFQVYRDALWSSLSEINTEDATILREAFNDKVLPEIHKMDLKVKHSKKLLRDSIRSNIIFGAGVITIGLASGFLPSDVGKIIASLGGLQFGIDALKNLNELLKEPPSVKEDQYYFLWKVKEAFSN
ncbi:MAG: hypothetical protein A2W09_04470 [Deltaproteobacteria bacterium RBG_16_50_11]|nr:MAG: hypothetical protein A2W09_04470 [Deltaproteobacteria bacterium RBG_16_50_11]